MKDVNEVMAERAQAAGLDLDRLSDTGQQVIPAVCSTIDQMLPLLQKTSVDLRVAAEVLRSYGDVAEEYADAIDQTGQGTA